VLLGGWLLPWAAWSECLSGSVARATAPSKVRQTYLGRCVTDPFGDRHSSRKVRSKGASETRWCWCSRALSQVPPKIPRASPWKNTISITEIFRQRTRGRIYHRSEDMLVDFLLSDQALRSGVLDDLWIGPQPINNMMLLQKQWDDCCDFIISENYMTDPLAYRLMARASIPPLSH
jgi:hypothetical protein